MPVTTNEVTLTPSTEPGESMSDENTLDSMDDVALKRFRNRMAQRKYRKKLKGRIQDLERQAAVFSNPAQAILPTEYLDHLSLSPIKSPAPVSYAVRDNHAASTNMVRGGGRIDLQLPGIEENLQKGQYKRGLSSKTNMIDDDMGLSMGSHDPNLPTTDGYKDNPILAMSPMSASNLDTGLFPACDGPTPTMMNGLRWTKADKTWHGLSSGSEASPYTLDNDQQSAQEQGIESRIGHVLDCIQLAGFDNLDAFVSAYYTDSFEKGSVVHKAQKISRNRSLPNVLAKLQDSAKTWSRWEVTGYCDEIMKSAESILLDELGHVYSQITAHGVDSLTRQTSLTQSASSSSTDQSSELTNRHSSSTLEYELPHLWALIATLTSDESRTIQRTKRQTLLEIISILAEDGT